ncbi:MAG: hypothetical protein GX589_03340 [Deltaproteobacteria bacterium]|nr:hypothetical protein [Deltaproteobacteria bacterium]
MLLQNSSARKRRRRRIYVFSCLILAAAFALGSTIWLEFASTSTAHQTDLLKKSLLLFPVHFSWSEEIFLTCQNHNTFKVKADTKLYLRRAGKFEVVNTHTFSVQPQSSVAQHVKAPSEVEATNNTVPTNPPPALLQLRATQADNEEEVTRLHCVVKLRNIKSKDSQTAPARTVIPSLTPLSGGFALVTNQPDIMRLHIYDLSGLEALADAYDQNPQNEEGIQITSEHKAFSQVSLYHYRFQRRPGQRVKADPFIIKTIRRNATLVQPLAPESGVFGFTLSRHQGTGLYLGFIEIETEGKHEIKPLDPEVRSLAPLAPSGTLRLINPSSSALRFKVHALDHKNNQKASDSEVLGAGGAMTLDLSKYKNKIGADGVIQLNVSENSVSKLVGYHCQHSKKTPLRGEEMPMKTSD